VRSWRTFAPKSLLRLCRVRAAAIWSVSATQLAFRRAASGIPLCTGSNCRTNPPTKPITMTCGADFADSAGSSGVLARRDVLRVSSGLSCE
jgi:hypothetical protein